MDLNSAIQNDVNSHREKKEINGINYNVISEKEFYDLINMGIADFEYCYFENIKFSSLNMQTDFKETFNFDGSYFNNSHFGLFDLSNAYMTNCIISDCMFDTVNMLSCNMNNSSIRHTYIINSNLSNVNLSNVSIQQGRIDNSELSNSDFLLSNINGTLFKNIVIAENVRNLDTASITSTGTYNEVETYKNEILSQLTYKAPETQISTEELESKDKLLNLLNNGIRDTLTSENYKNYLKTASKLFRSNYSFSNTLLVYLQKPDASYVMGYQAWKEFGRQVKLGAKSIEISMPIFAYEKKNGDLFKTIKYNLEKPFKDNPETEKSSYKLGNSNLEFTMLKNGIFGIKIGNIEKAIIPSEEMLKQFITKNILGKIPVGYKTVLVFDKSDVIIPEFLWVKSNYTESELALDKNGNKQRNKRGEVKIINTPERQARFVEYDYEVSNPEPQKMKLLFEALKSLSINNGVPIELASAEEDNRLVTAYGYYQRQNLNGTRLIRIRDNLNITSQCAVAIHEIAHSIVHRDMTDIEDKPQSQREIEAESIAFIVGQQFGIESEQKSFTYLSAWSRGEELQELRASLDTIFTESKLIIKNINAQLEIMNLTPTLEPIVEIQRTPEEIHSIISDAYDFTFSKQAEARQSIQETVNQLANGIDDTEKNIISEQVTYLNTQIDDLNELHSCTKEIDALSADNKLLPAQRELSINKITALTIKVIEADIQIKNLSESLFEYRGERGENYKDKFLAQPVKTLELLAKKYPEINNLSINQKKYITSSEYIKKSLLESLDGNPDKFVHDVLSRITAIENIQSKNGSFIEILDCEHWTEEIIFSPGTLLHPKAADIILIQAEKQMAKIHDEFDKREEYFPFSKCDFTVYSPNPYTNKLDTYSNRIDIGDGGQKGLKDFIATNIENVMETLVFQNNLKESFKEKNVIEKIFVPVLDSATLNIIEEPTKSDTSMAMSEWNSNILTIRFNDTFDAPNKQTDITKDTKVRE